MSAPTPSDPNKPYVLRVTFIPTADSENLEGDIDSNGVSHLDAARLLLDTASSLLRALARDVDDLYAAEQASRT